MILSRSLIFLAKHDCFVSKWKEAMAVPKLETPFRPRIKGMQELFHEFEF
jgi:hypothetical protein